jgi:hypothetical protein
MNMAVTPFISHLIGKGLICGEDLEKIVFSNGVPKDISIEELLLTSGVIAENKIQFCLEEFYGVPIATTEEGLKALRGKPSGVESWSGPYLPKEVPVDPWGKSYIHKSPGEHEEYDLFSYGLDGTEGGKPGCGQLEGHG